MRAGAFEHLFGPGRGNLTKNFPKNQMPGGGLSGGGRSFDLTGTLEAAVWFLPGWVLFRLKRTFNVNSVTQI